MELCRHARSGNFISCSSYFVLVPNATGRPFWRNLEKLDKGVETKVEVNAANGKIIEVSIEKWGIGEEADEKIIVKGGLLFYDRNEHEITWATYKIAASGMAT